MANNFLNLYDTLPEIGRGTFGIVRRVRRKSDGMIFARKELNFQRMSPKDRKQIAAEVNILKNMQHDHIVRYVERFVDHEAGLLYIIMEYCGGGNLSTVIKRAMSKNRPIPEGAIWDYFLQILLALDHCHNTEGNVEREQIVHRDLKPENVFLDGANSVKVGDFGLSKALVQDGFANTYVGTPHYMSPELMQGKAYNSKSDIWSLGCLIYELCSLKPPFNEAKTQGELEALIRNAVIPSLPRGYSETLGTPAMRPSAAQLLKHERIKFALMVSEREKRYLEIQGLPAAIQEAVNNREKELHAIAARREEEFGSWIQLREEEVMNAPTYNKFKLPHSL
ncbi:kinase-like domain-containing protein [Mycena leptocephala]|nr:kinase-like domain-containing protein [Mycena leptocephala]